MMKRITYTRENAISRPDNKYFMRRPISNKFYLLGTNNQSVTTIGTVFSNHMLPEGGNLLQGTGIISCD